MSNENKDLSTIWLTVIKDLLYKLLVKKLFKGAIVGGVKGFIFNKFFKFLFEEFLTPWMLTLRRKYAMVFRKLENEKEVKAVKEAKTDEELANEFKNMG